MQRKGSERSVGYIEQKLTMDAKNSVVSYRLNLNLINRLYQNYRCPDMANVSKSWLVAALKCD